MTRTGHLGSPAVLRFRQRGPEFFPGNCRGGCFVTGSSLRSASDFAPSFAEASEDSRFGVRRLGADLHLGPRPQQPVPNPLPPVEPTIVASPLPLPVN